MISGEAYSASCCLDATTASVIARVRSPASPRSDPRYLAVRPPSRWLLVRAGDHLHVWQRALVRVSTVSGIYGLILWLGLKRYPGTLLLYALGLGAVAARRLEFLGNLFATPIHREHGEDRPAVELLPPFCMFESGGGQVPRILEGMERRKAPLNDWIHDLLRDYLKRLIPNDEQYTNTFDTLEILMSLSAARHHEDGHQSEFNYFVEGAFGYRTDNTKRILGEFKKAVSSEGDGGPIVASRVVGNTADECAKIIGALEEWIPKLRWHWY